MREGILLGPAGLLLAAASLIGGCEDSASADEPALEAVTDATGATLEPEGEEAEPSAPRGPAEPSAIEPDSGSMETDASTPTVEDAAGDTKPEPEPEPESLDPEVTSSLCATFCQQIGATCGADAVPPLCTQQCEVEAGADPWALASWNCMTDACDPDLCHFGGDDAPLGLTAPCGAFCSALDLCDASTQFGLPEDDQLPCLAACSGAVIGDPGVLEAMDCWIDALDPTCQVAEIGACGGDVGTGGGGDGGAGALGTPESLCPSLCALVATPDSGVYCAPDTATWQIWQDAAACTAECSGQADIPAVLRWWGCIVGNGCQDPAICAVPSTVDSVACASACGAVFTMCDTLGGGIDDPSVCSPFCTGLMQHVVLDDGSPGANAGAGACVLASADVCPEEDALGGLFYGCLNSTFTPPLPAPTSASPVPGTWRVEGAVVYGDLGEVVWVSLDEPILTLSEDGTWHGGCPGDEEGTGTWAWDEPLDEDPLTPLPAATVIPTGEPAQTWITLARGDDWWTVDADGTQADLVRWVCD